jgi:hypothetical protein
MKKFISRIIILSIIAMIGIVISCIGPMSEETIEDNGKKQIGDNLYLKRLIISGEQDRVYLLVDKDDKLLSTNTNTSVTIHQNKQSHVESTALIGQ